MHDYRWNTLSPRKSLGKLLFGVTLSEQHHVATATTTNTSTTAAVAAAL